MNSRRADGIERDYAQSVNNAFPVYADRQSRRMVSGKTQARAQTNLRECLNRYPSPSLWSGPPRVRPPLFPNIKTRRQLAERFGFSGLLFGFARTYLWSQKTSQNQEGNTSCGSSSSPSQQSQALLWPDAVKHHCSKDCSAQAPESPVRPYWAAIWARVLSWVPLATLPIARLTRHAADLTTFSPGRDPGIIETACQTLRLAGRNALCRAFCPPTPLGRAI